MRRLILVVAVALAALVPVGHTERAGAADPGAEAQLAAWINQARGAVGVAPAQVHPVLTAKAQGWAEYMAATGNFAHSNLTDGITVGWTRLGENIGWGSSIAAVHQALLNSPPHYANIVDGGFPYIGVGVAYGGGRVWVAEEFMAGDPPPYVPPPAQWQAWGSLGGDLTSGPGVASWGLGRLDVFARGAGNQLFHRWYDRGWSGWEPLGGALSSEPAVASWAPGRLDVFARGVDNRLWHRYYDHGWAGWEPLGGALTSGPAAASWAPGRLDVFARGAGNQLFHRFHDRGWAGWEALGGSLTSTPAASTWGAGRLDVFVSGGDHAMWHRWFDGAWSGWESLGGTLTSGPGAASWWPSRIDAFARGSDGALWQRYYG